MRTVVAAFLLFHPLFSAKLPPGWNCPQYHLLTHRHGEVVDEVAWKIATFMAPLVMLILGASSDRALLAKLKALLREASLAGYLFGQDAIKAGQHFFEFRVVVTMRDENPADSAI